MQNLRIQDRQFSFINARTKHSLKPKHLQKPLKQPSTVPIQNQQRLMAEDPVSLTYDKTEKEITSKESRQHLRLRNLRMQSRRINMGTLNEDLEAHSQSQRNSSVKQAESDSSLEREKSVDAPENVSFDKISNKCLELPPSQTSPQPNADSVFLSKKSSQSSFYR